MHNFRITIDELTKNTLLRIFSLMLMAGALKVFQDQTIFQLHATGVSFVMDPLNVTELVPQSR